MKIYLNSNKPIKMHRLLCHISRNIMRYISDMPSLNVFHAQDILSKMWKPFLNNQSLEMNITNYASHKKNIRYLGMHMTFSEPLFVVGTGHVFHELHFIYHNKCWEVRYRKKIYYIRYRYPKTRIIYLYVRKFENTNTNRSFTLYLDTCCHVEKLTITATFQEIEFC